MVMFFRIDQKVFQLGQALLIFFVWTRLIFILLQVIHPPPPTPPQSPPGSQQFRDLPSIIYLLFLFEVLLFIEFHAIIMQLKLWVNFFDLVYQRDYLKLHY